LARAKQTGGVVAERLGVAPQVDARWDEQGFGDWDEESHEELETRVVAAWEEAVEAGGTVVVACHRKPILVVLGHVRDLPHESFWRRAGEPGSLTAIDARPDGRAVVTFTNRT